MKNINFLEAFKDREGYNHKNCNGQFTITGEIAIPRDIGMGFNSKRKFEVKVVYAKPKWNYYKGFCLKCSQEGIFKK